MEYNDRIHKRHVPGLSKTEMILIAKVADLINYRVEHKTADVKLTMLDFELHVLRETELLVQILDKLMDAAERI